MTPGARDQDTGQCVCVGVSVDVCVLKVFYFNVIFFNYLPTQRASLFSLPLIQYIIFSYTSVVSSILFPALALSILSLNVAVSNLWAREIIYCLNVHAGGFATIHLCQGLQLLAPENSVGEEDNA